MRKSVRNFNPTALRQARQAAGLRQVDLAEQLGVARTNYVRFETGQTDRSNAPNPATLRAIAEIVGVKPHELTTTRPDQQTLRDLREYAGLTQRDVANTLGFAATRSYADIEHGTRRLTTELAERIAAAVGVNVDDLVAAYDRTSHNSGDQ